MFDVITIGSSTKDVFMISKDFLLMKSNKFSTGIGECFAYGAKIEVADIHFDTGGGATNAAVTFGNLGLKASVVSNIGNDMAGQEVLNVLKSKRVDTKLIHKHASLKTGYSTILLSAKGDRTILVYRGASHDFQAAYLKPSQMKAKFYYLTSAGGNMKFNKEIFNISRKNNAYVFWNPGGAELAHGMDALKPLIKQTCIFSVNKEEAQKLTGASDVKKQLTILGALCPLVWITDGKNGAYVSAAGDLRYVPSLGTKALNATGAGDAFGSGFLAGLIISKDWETAARYAIINSDSVIQHMGAKTGILSKLPDKKKLALVKIKKF